MTGVCYTVDSKKHRDTQGGHTMKTICTLLDSTPNTAIALNTISNTIPCFISITDNGTVVECTITARQEDIAYVERELAALV